MIYLILIWSIFLFLLLPTTSMIALGVTNTSLINSTCYVCMHTSWLHLLINVLSILLLWFPIRRIFIFRYNQSATRLDIATYLAAIIAGLACASDIPTIGMSGMVFFLLGVLIALNPTKRQAINYLWIVATVAVQWFFGHSNVALHLFAFVEGVVYICVREFLYQYKHHTGLFKCSQ